MAEGDGRSIEMPRAFQNDDGRCDPRLAEALESGDGDAVVSALAAGARLLVPVVAVLDAVDDSGADKASHMASVSLLQADGRRGLLAFTSTESLARWDASARPVPVRAPEVAASALAEGADGILVDVSGPVRFALDGDVLASLAMAAGN